MPGRDDAWGPWPDGTLGRRRRGSYPAMGGSSFLAAGSVGRRYAVAVPCVGEKGGGEAALGTMDKDDDFGTEGWPWSFDPSTAGLRSLCVKNCTRMADLAQSVLTFRKANVYCNLSG